MDFVVSVSAVLSVLLLVLSGTVVVSDANVVQRFQIDPQPVTHNNKTFACYYTNNLLNETDVDPFVCTHILFASALMSPQGVVARKESDIYSWRLLVKLKEKNPSLKIMISACCSFDTVVGKGPEVLASFVNGTKQLLQEYNLDGIDFDWEFPGLFKRNEFFEVQKALSAMLRSEGKLFSAAMPHDLLVFIESYYTEAVNKYFDFMTIMTYDYHSYTPSTPYTDYNGPLTAAFKVINQIKDIAGVDPSKLLLGYPTYARSFKLADPQNHGHYAKAVGEGPPGPYLHTPGYYALPDVCLEVKQGGQIVQDVPNGAEYMYNGDVWVSFNGMASAKLVAEYIRSSGIGGVGFFALEFADFKNICKYGPYPVFNAIKKGVQ